MKQSKYIRVNPELRPPSLFQIIFFLQTGALIIVYILWKSNLLLWLGPENPNYKVQPKIVQEPISIFYIKNGKFCQERFSITHQYEEEKIGAILDRWASLLWKYKLIHQRITADFVSLDRDTQTLCVSISRRIFSKQSSTADKLRLLYGLFKSIEAAELPVKYCLLLHHYDVMVDEQLDMSIPWPINIIQKIE